MAETVLTADDLRLADEMSQLYGAKSKDDLSDNEVEFLRLFAVKNRSEACVRKLKLLETFARNSPFARGIPPNRKKTKNGNEISKTMAKSWIKSPNGC